MSGMKRKSKYRKHIENSVLEEFPEPSQEEEIVVVVGACGGNLLEVKPVQSFSTESVAKATDTGQAISSSLCLLPSKYRKLVWVKRGNYLIVSKAAEDYGMYCEQ